jgi:hypothetical protein
MTIAQKALQAVRIIHLACLGTAVAYLILPLVYAPASRQEFPPVFALALGILALSIMGAAVYFRTRTVQPASEVLRNNPEDQVAVSRWRGGVIFSLVFCESVVLLGVALRFIGVSWSVCGIFYAVGIFFLLAWRPRLELPPN